MRKLPGCHYEEFTDEQGRLCFREYRPGCSLTQLKRLDQMTKEDARAIVASCVDWALRQGYHPFSDAIGDKECEDMLNEALKIVLEEKAGEA